MHNSIQGKTNFSQIPKELFLHFLEKSQLIYIQDLGCTWHLDTGLLNWNYNEKCRSISLNSNFYSFQLNLLNVCRPKHGFFIPTLHKILAVMKNVMFHEQNSSLKPHNLIISKPKEIWTFTKKEQIVRINSWNEHLYMWPQNTLKPP